MCNMDVLWIPELLWLIEYEMKLISKVQSEVNAASKLFSVLPTCQFHQRIFTDSTKSVLVYINNSSLLEDADIAC